VKRVFKNALLKHQTPITKFQGRSKIQSPKRRVRGLLRYDGESTSSSAVVNDSEYDKDVSAKHPFDLEERTARFGEGIVRFSKQIPRGPTNNRLIDQLVGCGTSIGANYCEADERVSKKDFRNVIGRCSKEAKETKFFLRMIAASEPELSVKARDLFREARELHLIFASIYRKQIT
jgi:four helix bundle protein